MPDTPIAIRPGRPADEDALLALFDEAVAWMIARGQTGQWGDRLFSERPESRGRVHEMAPSTPACGSPSRRHAGRRR